MKSKMKNLYIIFAIIILLTPLGLLAPGGAWAEWGTDEVQKMVGYVPAGMNRFSEVMKAVLPDYSIPGFDQSFLQQALGYIFSAVVGIAVILIVFAILKMVMGKPSEKNE
ncbi:MAG: PDGLE domain-containing protein [Thermoanaerobacteraceae bacterium]|nr:PDGLE domain-containing protein [Thermoanaerobacteraceae bacterium]